MRLVVDTNLMIRALWSAGPARLFFRSGPLQHRIVYHAQQLKELRDVARRPRLAIAHAAVDELVARIEHYGERIESALEGAGDCRDPDDEYVLVLARVGWADVILTEDQDLLVMDPWNQIRIMRLHQFLRENPLSSR